MPQRGSAPRVWLSRPARFAELVSDVEDGKVSGTNAKAVLARAFESGESPRAIIEAEGLAQVSDSGYIAAEVAAVIGDHPSQVAEFRGGKQQIYGFLVGQVMKRTAGRADAKLVNAELRRQLAEEDT